MNAYDRPLVKIKLLFFAVLLNHKIKVESNLNQYFLRK